MPCWFSLSQVLSGYVSLFHVMICYVWLIHVKSLLVTLGQFVPGYIRSGYFRLVVVWPI
jgi:hypothetical protein